MDDRATLKVLSGRDHMTSPNNMLTWNGSGYTPGTTALERLCSADLADPSAFGLGAKNRIFLSGEETSPPFTADHGRVFAHIVDGPDKNKSFELPRLGKMSFENGSANSFPDHKTIVMLEDNAGRETNVTAATNVCRTAGQTGCTEAPSELYMYVGSQKPYGSQIEQAGLTNGNFYGIRVILQRASRHGREQGICLRFGRARRHLGPIRSSSILAMCRTRPVCRSRTLRSPIR